MVFRCTLRGVKPELFTAPEFGRATKKPGDKWAFWYFEPALSRRARPQTVRRSPAGAVHHGKHGPPECTGRDTRQESSLLA